MCLWYIGTIQRGSQLRTMILLQAFDADIVGDRRRAPLEEGCDNTIWKGSLRAGGAGSLLTKLEGWINAKQQKACAHLVSSIAAWLPFKKDRESSKNC